MLVGPGPEDQWHREAFFRDQFLEDGTYELVGPKVTSNAERRQHHELVAHDAAEVLPDLPEELTFESLRSYLATHDIEGIVWHHPDGRMAKLKGRDFGLKRIGRQ